MTANAGDSAIVDNLRQAVLGADDLAKAVTYADFNNRKLRRVTQIDFSSVSAGGTVRKTFSYTLDGLEYRLTSIVWSIV